MSSIASASAIISKKSSKVSSAIASASVRSSSKSSEVSSRLSKLATARAKAVFLRGDPVVQQVYDKLKTHVDYLKPYFEGEEMSPDDHEAMLLLKASSLVSKEELWHQFIHLTRDGVHQALEDVDIRCQLTHKTELLKKIERDHDYFEKARQLEIKLLICSLDDDDKLPGFYQILCSLADFIEAEYGATHTGLQIGDVVVDWNRGSLVIPKWLKPGEDSGYYFQADIRYCSKFYERMAKNPPQSSNVANNDGACAGEVSLGLFVEAAFSKVDVINSVIDTIVKYNRSFYYNAVGRNCQTFVSDTLKALEVVRPEFRGKLGQFFDNLKQGDVDGNKPHGFASHGELNKEIDSGGTLQGLDLDDLQFYASAYSYFHYVLPDGSDCDKNRCSYHKVKELIAAKLRHAPPQ